MVINKSKAAFRTIAEVADKLGVGTHVLRFWETKFSQIKPLKMQGGRRYYRPDDVKLLECIQNLLYNQRYTIEGVQKLFKEKGIKSFVGDTIQDDFFAPAEQNENEEKQADKAPSLSPELVSSIIKELSSIRQELQDNLK